MPTWLKRTLNVTINGLALLTLLAAAGFCVVNAWYSYAEIFSIPWLLIYSLPGLIFLGLSVLMFRHKAFRYSAYGVSILIWAATISFYFYIQSMLTILEP
ncbi:MAG: hypothetical protein CMF50_01350 [Legionellales bacterium]|nr:hypothetical protein [Legionellales bacterium]|tara:strand:+ start:16503 stop:16802 length:300 start_codon:yes stop_codon:yes gene_type:complete